MAKDDDDDDFFLEEEEEIMVFIFFFYFHKTHNRTHTHTYIKKRERESDDRKKVNYSNIFSSKILKLIFNFVSISGRPPPCLLSLRRSFWS